MANKQQQLAIQRQISHMNKKQLIRSPSFSERRDDGNSFSRMNNMTEKPQEPYSSEGPCPKRLIVDCEAWLGPRKPEPSSSELPCPKRPAVGSEAWPGPRKQMPFPSQTPSQHRATPGRGPPPKRNSRPTNTIPNNKFYPGMKRKADLKFLPAAQRRAPATDLKFLPAALPLSTLLKIQWTITSANFVK